MTSRVERRALLGPAWLRKAAARRRPKDEAWMLLQGRAVRESFIRDVLDRGDDEVDREAWMLRQPDAVRESYIREVLER